MLSLSCLITLEVNYYLISNFVSAAVYAAKECPSKAIELVEVDGKRRPQIRTWQIYLLLPMRRNLSPTCHKELNLLRVSHNWQIAISYEASANPSEDWSTISLKYSIDLQFPLVSHLYLAKLFTPMRLWKNFLLTNGRCDSLPKSPKRLICSSLIFPDHI